MVKKLPLVASKYSEENNMSQHNSLYINIIPLIINQGISKLAAQSHILLQNRP